MIIPSDSPTTTHTLKLWLLLRLRGLGNTLSFGGRFSLPQLLLQACFRHVHGKTRVPDFDGNLDLELSLSDHMQRRIFWTGYYNRRMVVLFDRMLKAGMTVIDVGANLGEISMTTAKRVGRAGRVIAFEPVDAIADQLQANATRNHLDQITIVRAGLSDAPADNIPVYASCGQDDLDDENAGLGSLFGGRQGAPELQRIPITTLDIWLAAHPVDRIDLIKIDIEGAELPCLRGAEGALRRFRPVLIVEIQDTTATTAGYRASDILAFLSGLGYTFETIRHGGHLTTLTENNLEAFQNVLCKPGVIPRAT